MYNDTLIVIPVRMGSSRFPGKPLININGKAMIYHVWQKAKLSNCGDVLVACCDEMVKEYLMNKNIPYVMTKKNLNSGTDRVYEAIKISLKKKTYKYVLNLQGDLPNISSKSIKNLISIIKTKSVKMATLVSKINDKIKLKDKNIVKVALSRSNGISNAVYFSRSPIPYGADMYYQHIGIYAYTISTLKKFVSLSMGNLEKIESLEQLRALENNITIRVGEISKAPISIDTPTDLKNLLKIMKRKK